ncbi:hypothetical protein PR048_013434 [Dryococelus australis]|uniref:DUF4817 domain-containing protein n=1 Tax=Dryococelus australis TaxID=614101 RepID=A0ABQ9HS61_9NEOP|nr:hypothetical protein PR048_013434 [Dryococelus australis]
MSHRHELGKIRAAASIADKKPGGSVKSVRTQENIDSVRATVLQCVAQAAAFNVSKSSVCRIKHANNELTDIHLIYGAANTNARQAVNLYRLHYPALPQPFHVTFVLLHQRLRDEGSTIVTRPNLEHHRQGERWHLMKMYFTVCGRNCLLAHGLWAAVWVLAV